ncbi:hypothetical protein SEA_VANLEE_12 [Gordonia phage VanLee]|uniref:Uncharacterized protein n=1 Tax=Gordonia phage VanLee TaxID=2845816 RepID=A0A8F2D9B6_9CAUD|nr:hypothetical protein QEH49_gp012 [Gordonia phage VanLee]QWS68130.1 hypothetical protein SEA_VANLEE_12 [Gordonia phage VanLee]
MTVKLSPGTLDRVLRSPEVVDNLQDRLDRGAAFWNANARKDTGFMAQAVHTEIVEQPGGPEGHLEFTADYAGYQEYGTRYIEGMHLTQDILAIMNEDPA